MFKDVFKRDALNNFPTIDQLKAWWVSNFLTTMFANFQACREQQKSSPSFLQADDFEWKHPAETH